MASKSDDRIGSILAKAGNIAQILSFFPGAYCAYGTYVVLHPASPNSSSERIIAHPNALLIAFGAFAALLILGFLLRLFSPKPLDRTDLKRAEQSEPKELSVPATDLHADCIRQRHERALTIVQVNYSPLEPGNYPDKVWFVIKNTSGENVNLWAPIWEVDPTNRVFAKQPIGTAIWKMASALPSVSDKAEDQGCVMLTPGEQVRGWIGLLEPAGEGLSIRVKRGTTGYLVFPLKVSGKLWYEKIKI